MGASVFFESASELARLSNTFTVAGAATDPTTVTLTLTSPSGVATAYTYAASEITKSATGAYHKDVTCSAAGEWTYQWVGTGAATDSTVGTFTVLETTVGRLYATVEALKSRLGISASDVADDYELHGACFAASRAVEQHCRRVFWRTASGTVRTFQAESTSRVTLPFFSELVSASAVATDEAGDGTFETTWAATDYQLLPFNTSGPEPRPYTQIRTVGTLVFPTATNSGRVDRVQITGVFGWSTVPPGVRQAALMLAQEAFKSKDSVGGVAGFGEFGVVRLGTNPLYNTLVGPYRRLVVM